MEFEPAQKDDKMTGDERWQQIRHLRRTRPIGRWLRVSALAMALCLVATLSSGLIEVGDLFSPRRAENLRRFLVRDAMPFPLRENGFSLQGLWAWMSSIWNRGGREASAITLGIGILSTALATGLALLLAPLASRCLMHRAPYEWRADRNPSTGVRRFPSVSEGISACARSLCVLMRAMPEFILAYLFLAIFGVGVWPLVLALAIHNGGILGRLGSETIENLEPQSLRSLRMLGAGRGALAWCGVRPAALSRFLLYVFYRYETCVREATVLGMLGVVSLGYWIEDARARQRYDDMLLYILFGAGLVLLGEATSIAARRILRRA